MGVSKGPCPRSQRVVLRGPGSSEEFLMNYDPLQLNVLTNQETETECPMGTTALEHGAGASSGRRDFLQGRGTLQDRASERARAAFLPGLRR